MTDKHAENKALYKQDAIRVWAPYSIWQYRANDSEMWMDSETWMDCSREPKWGENVEYRRKKDAPIWIYDEFEVVERQDKSHAIDDFRKTIIRTLKEKEALIDSFQRLAVEGQCEDGVTGEIKRDMEKIYKLAKEKLEANAKSNEYLCKNGAQNALDMDIEALNADQDRRFAEWIDTAQEDPGAHYRRTYTVKITPTDIKNGFVTVTLTPYRIVLIWKMIDHMEFFILKKVLRMGSAHKNKRQECLDIINAAQERIKIIDEDEVKT